MVDKIKFGIIGFGRMAELIHLPLIKQIPKIEVVGIFDLTEKRRLVASKRGFRVFSELDEILAEDIDAVLIASPPSSHFETACRAVKSGKHVLVEKPVTLNHQDTKTLSLLAYEYGKVVTVFHNHRYDPDFKLVESVIQSDMLGDILFVNRNHHMFGTGTAFAAKSFDAEWRNKKQYGGGALNDWGVHLIDQLLHLKLGEVVAVDGTIYQLPDGAGQVDDFVRASCVLKNDILLSMEVNFRSHASLPAWVVGGNKGCLQVYSDKKAEVMRKGQFLEKLDLEPSSRFSAKPIYQSFIEQIQGTGVAEVTMEQALEVMKIMDEVRGPIRNRSFSKV